MSNMKSYRFGYNPLNYGNQNFFRTDFRNSDSAFIFKMVVKTR